MQSSKGKKPTRNNVNINLNDFQHTINFYLSLQKIGLIFDSHPIGDIQAQYDMIKYRSQQMIDDLS